MASPQEPVYLSTYAELVQLASWAYTAGRSDANALRDQPLDWVDTIVRHDRDPEGYAHQVLMDWLGMRPPRPGEPVTLSNVIAADPPGPCFAALRPNLTVAVRRRMADNWKVVNRRKQQKAST